MSVCFIRNALTGNVKIGWTERLVRYRLKELQTGSDGELELLLEIARGTEKTEAFLHEKFAAYRLRGEWFFFAPAVRRFLEAYKARPEDWVPRSLADGLASVPWGCGCVPTSPRCCRFCLVTRRKAQRSFNERWAQDLARKEFIEKLRALEARVAVEFRGRPVPEDLERQLRILRAAGRESASVAIQ